MISFFVNHCVEFIRMGCQLDGTCGNPISINEESHVRGACWEYRKLHIKEVRLVCNFLYSQQFVLSWHRHVLLSLTLFPAPSSLSFGKINSYYIICKWHCGHSIWLLIQSPNQLLITWLTFDPFCVVGEDPVGLISHAKALKVWFSTVKLIYLLVGGTHFQIL